MDTDWDDGDDSAKDTGDEVVEDLVVSKVMITSSTSEGASSGDSASLTGASENESVSNDGSVSPSLLLLASHDDDDDNDDGCRRGVQPGANAVTDTAQQRRKTALWNILIEVTVLVVYRCTNTHLGTSVSSV